MKPRIIICETCASPGGATEGAGFAEALRARVEGVAVETVACLNVCGEPMAVALRGEGQDAYLFAGVEARDLEDAVALCRLYRDAAPGIEDAREAGRLRFCLKGRIPA